MAKKKTDKKVTKKAYPFSGTVSMARSGKLLGSNPMRVLRLQLDGNERNFELQECHATVLVGWKVRLTTYLMEEPPKPDEDVHIVKLEIIGDGDKVLHHWD